MEEIGSMTVHSALPGQMSGVASTVIPEYGRTITTRSSTSGQDVLLVQTSSEDNGARSGGLRKTVSILAIAPTKKQFQSEATGATVFVGAGGTSSVASTNSAANPTANWTQTSIPEVQTTNGHHGTESQDHRKGLEQQLHSAPVLERRRQQQQQQQQQALQSHQTAQHVVKIRINPELDTSKVISTIRLNPDNSDDGSVRTLKSSVRASISDNGKSLDRDNSTDEDPWERRKDVVRSSGRRNPNESAGQADSRVRISVVSGDISNEQHTDSHRENNHENQQSHHAVTSESTKKPDQSKLQNEMIQQRAVANESVNVSSINRGSACFYYGSFPNSLTTMMMSSGQCSPSDTLDSGTCSDLDGTPPPLPKKKNSSTVLLGVSPGNGSPMIGSGKGSGVPGSQPKHNRAGSVTSSGPELDSDDNESNISCDSLNSGELASRIIEHRSIRVNGVAVDDKNGSVESEERNDKVEEKIRGNNVEDKRVMSGDENNFKTVSDDDDNGEDGECNDFNDTKTHSSDIKNNNDNNNNKNNKNVNEHEESMIVKDNDGAVDEKIIGKISCSRVPMLPIEITTASSSSSTRGTSPSVSPSPSGASSLSKASSTPRVRSPVSNGHASPVPTSPMVKECTYEERNREQNRIDEENAAADYYANHNRKNGTKYLYDDDRFYKFHINENQSENENDDDSKIEEKDSDEYFAGYKILDREAIRSAKGTVRGVKNRVRAGIATFLQKPSTKNYKTRDAGKIVVYITSMSIVRETYFACIKMLQILKTHMVKHEVRDMFMSRELQTELKERIGCESIEVPQLFIDGQLIGNADAVERLNESGELRRMFKPYKSPDACTTCVICGGCRLLPCQVCSGSKKSPVRNDFMKEFYWLRCMNCDEVGLVRCTHC